LAHFDSAFLDMVRGHDDTDVLPGASADAIADAATTIDVELPPSHCELLAHFNGGAIASIRLFGVGRDDSLDLVTSFQAYSDIPAVPALNMLPFASDWGGSLYCFDLANPLADGEFSVWYWCHEYSEEPADAPYVWHNTRDGFADFMRKLFS
tara:strand:- start:60 stop:515 length:456 start_codon:yes stop_codon:yes gene_type:complete